MVSQFENANRMEILAAARALASAALEAFSCASLACSEPWNAYDLVALEDHQSPPSPDERLNRLCGNLRQLVQGIDPQAGWDSIGMEQRIHAVCQHLTQFLNETVIQPLPERLD